MIHNAKVKQDADIQKLSEKFYTLTPTKPEEEEVKEDTVENMYPNLPKMS
jgi:hypothetical protein